MRTPPRGSHKQVVPGRTVTSFGTTSEDALGGASFIETPSKMISGAAEELHAQQQQRVAQLQQQMLAAQEELARIQEDDAGWGAASAISDQFGHSPRGAPSYDSAHPKDARTHAIPGLMDVAGVFHPWDRGEPK